MASSASNTETIRARLYGISTAAACLEHLQMMNTVMYLAASGKMIQGFWNRNLDCGNSICVFRTEQLQPWPEKYSRIAREPSTGLLIVLSYWRNSPHSSPISIRMSWQVQPARIHQGQLGLDFGSIVVPPLTTAGLKSRLSFTPPSIQLASGCS